MTTGRASAVAAVVLSITITGCATAPDEPVADNPVPSTPITEASPLPSPIASSPSPTNSPTVSARPIPAPARRPDIEPRHGVEYARAEAVLNKYRDTIQHRYREVQGTGITAIDLRYLSQGPRRGPIYCIGVFVNRIADLPTTPQSIAGVPLKFWVSGRFSAQAQPAR